VARNHVDVVAPLWRPHARSCDGAVVRVERRPL